MVFVFVKTVTGGYSDFCKSQFRRKQAADLQSVVCVCVCVCVCVSALIELSEQCEYT